MSEEKFSKCGKGGKCKCKISGVRKKNERKVPEKKSKCFWVRKKKIFLSSYSLVELYVNLQVKVTEKFDENFQSIFRVSFEVKVAIC